MEKLEASIFKTASESISTIRMILTAMKSGAITMPWRWLNSRCCGTQSSSSNHSLGAETLTNATYWTNSHIPLLSFSTKNVLSEMIINEYIFKMKSPGILFCPTSILFASVLRRKTFWWLLSSMLLAPLHILLYTQRSCWLPPVCFLWLCHYSDKRCNPCIHTLVSTDWQAIAMTGRSSCGEDGAN